MSTTVAVGSMQATSTSASAEDMVRDLSPEAEEKPKPRVLVDKGQPVEEEPEKDGISKAASELGRKGGEAAAKAKAKAAREAEKAKAAKAADEKPGPKEAAEEDDEPADAAEQDEEQAGKPRDDPRARIRQLAEQRRAAEERAARAERDLAEERRRQSQPPAERSAPAPASAQAARTPADADPEPDEGDFEVYTDYVKAVAAHTYRQEARRHQQYQAAHAMATREANEVVAMVDGWRDALRKAAETDAGYRDKVAPVLDAIGYPTRILRTVENAPRPNASNWIADDLMSAPELAVKVLPYLAEHPDELQRVAALSSPRAVTRELATIAARLDAATAGTSSRREVSKAKPPVPPVTGSPRADSGELDDKAPLSSFVHRFAQREFNSSRR